YCRHYQFYHRSERHEAKTMQKLSAVPHEEFNAPKGIQRVRQLPDPKLGALWDSIVLDDHLKAQLVSQAMLNFTMRGKVDRSVIPLHGVILLVGPPGTGKTSLARGTPHRRIVPRCGVPPVGG
ncbi:MAG: hypothetical protein ABL931_16680, partial [Usitatibacteraceae bacterium]